MLSFLRRKPRSAGRRHTLSARPRLEVLEDRCLLSAGSLDPTFGAGAGFVTTAVAAYGSWANSVLTQPDGKILASGGGYFGSNNAAPPEVFAVARYNPDGSLDTAFGNGGHAVANFPGNAIGHWSYSNSYVAALYPQAGTANDGKIVLAGRHDTKNGTVFALARFNANGTLDATFGTNKNNPGEVTTSFPVSLGAGMGAHGVVIQADGKIVAAGGSSTGFVLARYNVNGTLDKSFGNGGEVVTSLGQLSKAGGGSLLLEPDGKLIVTGSTQTLIGGYYRQVWELARYNANGTLDTSFGTNGLVRGPFADPSNVVGCSAALYPSGTTYSGDIVVIGQSASGGELARFNPNGTLDSTFGNGGQVISTAYFQSVAIATDGKVVAVGGTNNSDIGLVVARYNTNGSPDSTFGTGGIVTYAISDATGKVSPNGVALQSNGDILVAANTSNFLVARLLPSEPQIGSFTASQPAQGADVTLTVSNITDGNPGSVVTQVTFYYFDGSGNKVTLGSGTPAQTSPGVWTFSFTVNLTPGTYALFAQAEDGYGVLGDPLALDLQVL